MLKALTKHLNSVIFVIVNNFTAHIESVTKKIKNYILSEKFPPKLTYHLREALNSIF